MRDYRQELMRVLDTGIALSKEKDSSRLLSMILDASMDIAGCDAGTLYMNKDGFLHFKVMRTISMGVDRGRSGETIDMPPVPLVPQNICAYTVLSGRTLNIPDVYQSDEFDFSGPKNYDRITGYRTESMLTIPLINQEDDAVGVIQLINAMDDDGRIIEFSPYVEKITLSLASQAAIAITNIQYMEEMKNQMWSFTEAMAEAIDARTPYNANHVRNVAMYAGKLADYINAMHDAGQEEEYFSQERKEQLVMSALLHDLGKMAVPTKIMNKATRLEEKLDAIGHRFETFRLRYRIQLLEGRITSEEYERKTGELDRIWQLVNEINSAGFLDDEREERIRVSFDRKFIEEGRTEPFFTEEEKEALLIKKGTLTAGERTVMESHVDMTERILNKVHFSSRDKDVAKWALQHHECLNGKGYPKRLAGDELCLESRILAVADICDALLASDRPYKKPMPQEKAFAIMEDMARSGSIDGKLVEYLEQCIRKDEAGGEVD